MLCAVLAASASGCESCDDGGPRVPFTIDGAASARSASPPSASSPAAGGLTAEGAPPPDPGKLVVAGRTVTAPAGRRFLQALRADADGDREDDAFIWSQGDGGGELLFVSSKGHAEALAVLHAEKARPGCRIEPHLRRLGGETVLLALDIACEGEGAPRASLRWVVVRLPPPGDGAPEARLVIDRRDPPPGERLAIDVTASDRDTDGREDVVLQVTLEGAPAPFVGGARATAQVIFLDRPAGYTLDPSEPDASFARAAADLGPAARRPADAASAAASAIALVRLGAALCGDLGAPLVSTTSGGIRCAELRPMVDALAATAWAALSLRDLPGAFAAAEALRALGDRAATQRKAVDQALEKEAPVTEARVVARVPLDPAPSTAPLSPPLVWDQDGHLLVVRGSEVARVAPDGSLDLAEAAPWPRAVRWSSRGETATLASLVRRCGPSALVATVERGAGRFTVQLPDLGSLIPKGLLAEPCTAGRVDAGVLSLGPDRAVIAAGPALFALVEGDQGLRAERVVLPALGDPPGPPGGARTVDGGTVVFLALGDAVVIDARGARRLRAAEVGSAASCSPASGGARLACVGARGITILEAEVRR